MISSLLPEHHRQGREHALVFSVEASLNFLSRPYVEADRAAVASHLNRRHRLKVRSQLGPQLTNADTGAHDLDHASVYTS
jgi:hypothetical protein